MIRSNLVSRLPLSFTNPHDTLRQTNRAKIVLKSCNLNQALLLPKDPYKSFAPATSLQKELARGPGRLFYRQLEQKAMRWPGIEPGSTAWKAAMLTTIPPTQSLLHI